MTLTIDLTPAETELMQKQATAANTSMESFAHEAALKAARNAEYLAMLDRGFKQIAEGTCTPHELIELD